MRIVNGQIQFSASDVAKHLACRHLSSLDLRAARGQIQRPYWHDPGVKVLVERGYRHEAAYLAHLKNRGLDLLADEADLDENARVQRTVDAMRVGVRVIAQADLTDGKWRGRADVLLRVDRPSNLGDWSYEVVDTKLARETRGGTILQLCLYSELVANVQGVFPDCMHVISPGHDYEPETFRLQDFLAYYRYVKIRLDHHDPDAETYPHPVEHCDLCQWWPVCNDRRRTDDHLSFVAGITKLQIAELRNRNITTLARLATTFMDEKIHHQARLQFAYRNTGKPVHELLALEPERGLARLPEPSAGDIFLDFESDPFVDEGGIEYLLGYVTLNDSGEPEYTGAWAFDRSHERRALESFIDMVTARTVRYPGLHIYHYSHYEPTALKRLMGRYATREDEIDRMLRAGVLVDLYGAVKQSLRASVEGYSLKDLELFFGFVRKTDLRDARQSLRALECALELNELDGIPPAVLETVEGYNREDCVSTLRLRDWLEGIRHELVRSGKEIPRPVVASGDPSATVDERRQRTLDLMNRLLLNIPDDPSLRTHEQQAQWLLAHMLEFHRREEKAPWWEYFRLRVLTDDERFEERYAIGGLEFVVRDGGTDRSPIHRYRFPPQDLQVREGDNLETSTAPFGNVIAIDIAARTLDVKKRSAMAGIHPGSVFVHRVVQAKEAADSLFRLGSWVADNPLDAPGPYRAARDLLLRNPPRLQPGTPNRFDDPLPLDHGVLPIQGPPGSGKTFTGARMICALLRAGKKVGITAVSHKVIRKLLEEVLIAAKEQTLTIQCIQKVTDKSEVQNPAIPETTRNDQILTALQTGEAHVAAGTAWLWARLEFAESVDVLFVDEAGQMSLADVLAVSQGARSIVLLGDPQQLEQPLQGTHPPGVAVSALQHVLGAAETMPPEAGLFLAETWRLSPSICEFTSELFYENRLKPHAGLERQKLIGPTRFAGTGLWFVPATHEGNQSSSNEEADLVVRIVADLLQSGVAWVDKEGEARPLKLKDILIVSPYNAQVFKLAERLPGANIGTVDKFQGQEAPVVIYSTATSSPEDAPRGMEFLYSANRFNVATSRARCVCILVASPLLLEPQCQTPRQMKLANVLCRYRELAVQTEM